jgi:hypothetical protein
MRLSFMRIIFSRKGFDSAAGSGPSPIVDGRPVTLPIPGLAVSRTTYGTLGLGRHVQHASRGRYDADSFCHHDPMFLSDGTCLFGQCDAAQSHLANQDVGMGDVFLFFGLFREARGEPHHRIFGYLRVAEVVSLATCGAERLAELAARSHPHALASHGRNDTIYVGEGRMANRASDALRLSVPGGVPTVWRVPAWLQHGNLTYHQKPERWLGDGLLRAAPRGQEFVANIAGNDAAHAWLDAMLAEIRGS